MGYQHLPKCGAYARSAGRPCQHCAMANGRCYYHGGASIVKSGRYTKQAIKKKREEGAKIKLFRESIKVIGEIHERQL